MSFEWDEQKRLLNLRKHRVDFADAVTALEDDNALTMPDDDERDEDRFVRSEPICSAVYSSWSTHGEGTRYG